MSTWDLPAELREPRQGAPITHDDLLDFHQTLYDDKAFLQAHRHPVARRGSRQAPAPASPAVELVAAA
ncbi:MAG: hypothetical protein R2755_10700 [Acidimicrobiales bacterium]